MNNQLPREIFQRWIHSREEDFEDVRVYRPRDYPFPPARGRDGFEFKPNGEFIRYGIAPTDQLQPIKGTWQPEANNQIRVSFEGEKQQSYIIQIVSFEKEVLKVRLIF